MKFITVNDTFQKAYDNDAMLTVHTERINNAIGAFVQSIAARNLSVHIKPIHLHMLTLEEHHAIASQRYANGADRDADSDALRTRSTLEVFFRVLAAAAPKP